MWRYGWLHLKCSGVRSSIVFSTLSKFHKNTKQVFIHGIFMRQSRPLTHTRSVTSDNYVYSRLRDPLRDIRIAVLQPGLRSEPIRVNVLQQELGDLDGTVNYSALSYVWGSPDFTCKIQFGDSVLKITSSLESALRHLRDSTQPKRLWIDALCINQLDIEERELQVSIMKSIYSYADEVIAWLGPASEDSDLAMEIMSGRKASVVFQPDRVPKISTSTTLMDFQRGLVALRRLFERAWWRRVWVIQEATTRTRPVRLYCGNKNVPWNACATTLENLRDLVTAAQSSQGIHYDCQRDFIIHTELRRDLLTILHPAQFLVSQREYWNRRFRYTTQLGWVRGFGASDPRDIVWVAEGLTSRKALPNKPDYSMTVSETFLYSVRKCFEHDGLQFLEHCDLRDRDSNSMDLPTFVPEWRCSPARARLRGTVKRFNASKGRQYYEVHGFLNSTSKATAPHEPSEVQSQNYPPVIYAKGVLVDEIVHFYSLPPIMLYYGIGIEHVLARLLSYVRPTSHEISGTVRSILDIVSAGQSQFYPKTEEIIRDIAGIYEIFSSSTKRGEVTDKAFVQDVGGYLKKIPHVEQRAIRLWVGRTVARLGKYPMALTPRTVRPGDVVCILFGLRVPIALRPDGEGAYQVVGECYVPGIMYGEALSMVGDIEGQARTFKIV